MNKGNLWKEPDAILEVINYLPPCYLRFNMYEPFYAAQEKAERKPKKISGKRSADNERGEYHEFYREAGKKRCVDAVIISIALPEHETFEGMQRMAKYFFEDLKPVEKQKKQDKAKGQNR